MLPTSRSHVGRRMGFGFVSVEAEMVDHVLAFDGSEVKGRPVKGYLGRWLAVVACLYRSAGQCVYS